MRIRNNIRFTACIILVILVSAIFLTGCYGNQRKILDITSVEELTTERIGVQVSTLYEDCLLETNPNVKISYFTIGTDMVFALEKGKIDGFLLEDLTYKMYKKDFPWLKLLEGYTDMSYVGVAVSKKDQVLNEQLNEFIRKSSEDGTLDELKRLWMDERTDDQKVDKSGITGENGEISIAVESVYIPFSYISYGELQGYDIDLVYRFCREYGYKPVFLEVEYPAIPVGIETGRFNLGMNVVITEERGENMIITEPYASVGIYVAVAGEGEEEENFFMSLADSFNKTFIKENRWMLFVEGTCVTLIISLLSVIFGTVLGFLIYLSCKGGNKIINKVKGFFCWLIGDIPSLILLMILFYVVFVGKASIGGIWVSIIGFTILFGFTVLEIIETSVLAIGKGQFEAAAALGYSPNQTFFNIILPQASKIAFPSMKREIVSLVKETSIVGYISVADLTRVSDLVRGRTFEAFFPLIATTIIYFFIIWFIIFLINKVEFVITDEKQRVKMIKKGIKIR